MELFGLRLKTLRLDRGLTQKELANKLGVVKASVSGYETGGIYPSIEVLIQICKYFEVSADYVLGLADTMDFQISHLTDEQVGLMMNLITQFERLNSG